MRVFQTKSKKTVHKNPYYKVDHDKYVMPNKEIGDYYGIRGLRTVFVIPFLTKNKIIITKQFRYLCNRWSLEFPAGRIDKKGDTPLKAAHRELEEETGYKAAKMSKIALFTPCNGLSDERCYVYVATDLTKTQQQLDDSESIVVKTYTLDQFVKLIKNNSVWDGMTLASWQLYESKLK